MFSRDVEISYGSNEADSTFDFDMSQRGRATLQDLEFYSTREPLTRKSLFLKAQSIWGRGFYLLSDNEEALKICNRIIRLPGFKERSVEAIKHAFGYGMGYLEIVWNDIPELDDQGNPKRDKDGFRILRTEGNSIEAFGIADPKSMTPKWDDHGDITFYEQKFTSGRKAGRISMRKKQFAYFRFDRIADDVRGYGLVEPLIPTIHGIMEARLNIRQLIKRHSVPLTHVKKTGARKEEIPKLKLLAKNISSGTSFASSEKLDLKFHGLGEKLPDFAPHIDIYFKSLSGGLDVPLAIILQEGEKSNKAVLDRIALWNYDATQMYQEKVATIYEDQIFQPAIAARNIKADVQVIWYPIAEELEESQIKNNFEYVKMLNAAKEAGAVSEAEFIKMVRDKLNIQRKEITAESQVGGDYEKFSRRKG